MAVLKSEHLYTYADLLTWSEEERWELFGGFPVMQAAPSTMHQRIERNFLVEIAGFLKGKPCEVFSPLSVRLEPKKNNTDKTVFAPDIVVVCDKTKLDKNGCNGAPDFIIEVLSPSTAKYDRKIKLEAYRRCGVREYWIADPAEKIVQAHILNNGHYIVNAYDEDDVIPVHTLSGLEISLVEIFID